MSHKNLKNQKIVEIARDQWFFCLHLLEEEKECIFLILTRLSHHEYPSISSFELSFNSFLHHYNSLTIIKRNFDIWRVLSHQLALIMSLPFVHTALHYYRVNGNIEHMRSIH